MARNRRNVRRRKITEYLTMKTFLIIVSILIVIIFVCVGINEYRVQQDRNLLAQQKEELERQSQEIFSAIDSNIDEVNQSISEADSIIRISAVGDALCGDAMIEDAYDPVWKTYNFTQMFDKVTGYIERADVIIGTMETNFTSGEYNSENAPKEFAEAVKGSGVGLVSICHNHSLDYGIQGLKDTKKVLQDLGYDVYGDKIGKEDNTILIKEIKDSKFAFLTYTYGVNAQASKTSEELKSINIYSEEQAKKDIAYAKKKGADYICVLIHWGDAISFTVNQEQKDIADYLVDNGVDVIIGAHPSVVQPMEVRKNKEGKNVFIAYSIGTYISNLSDEDSRTELVLNIELRKSGKDGEIYLNKVDYTPIYVLDNGEGAQNRYELIDMKSVASDYTSGNQAGITRETYDKLIRAIKMLDTTLKK